jgi:hypothetical protein
MAETNDAAPELVAERLLEFYDALTGAAASPPSPTRRARRPVRFRCRHPPSDGLVGRNFLKFLDAATSHTVDSIPA